MQSRTRILIILLLALVGLGTLGLPAVTTADVPFGDPGQLIASSTWSTIGGNYRHTGRTTVIGPANPVTRWRTQITRQPGLMDENAFMRSTYLGSNGFLYVGAGMAGVYRLRANDGALVSPSLYSVRQGPGVNGGSLLCSGGETWVEDITVAEDNTLYFVNEGGCVWAVDGNTLRLKWQKVHGFLHGPPALYPHPVFGTVVFVMSPDGYVKGLRASDGTLVLRYRFTNGTGNKEAVREKGFAIDDDGTLYFAWKDRLFQVNPLVYTTSGDMAVKEDPVTIPVDPIPIPAASAGPVGPITVNDNKYLFLSGEGTFVRINLKTRAVSTYGIGSTLCQTGAPFCDSNTASKTGKERWPAVSADGKTVYFSASNGLLYALNNGDNPVTSIDDDWKPRWVYRTGSDGYFSGIKSDPLIDAQGAIYVYTAEGEIHAVWPDGSRKWRTGDVGAYSGVRDSFYFGTNLAMDAAGTLFVSTTGPNPANGVLESYVWAVGNSGAATQTPISSSPPTATPTPSPTNVPPTATPVATEPGTPAPTTTPSPAASPAPSATASSTATATNTPTATRTLTSTRTPTPGPSATATTTPNCPPLPATANPLRLLICPGQVSATTNGQPSGNSAFAVDGQTWTVWSSNWGTPSRAELRIELPTTTPIGEVRWLVGSNVFMDDYDVEISVDGITWSPLVALGPNTTVKLNASLYNSNTLMSRVVSVNARYLRWSLRNPGADSKIGSIQEIEVLRQP